jgi:hypothetical protein
MGKSWFYTSIVRYSFDETFSKDSSEMGALFTRSIIILFVRFTQIVSMKTNNLNKVLLLQNLWYLSLWAASIDEYNTPIVTGDRATLGSDPSTVAMLYSIAGINMMPALFYLQAAHG